MLDGLSANERWSLLLGVESSQRKSADFLAEWLARDRLAAVKGFGELVRRHPDAAWAAAVRCGTESHAARWDLILKVTRQELRGDALAVFEAGIAVGMTGENPVAALSMVSDETSTGSRMVLSAKQQARQLVIERTAQGLPSLAIEWVAKEAQGSSSAWQSLCRGLSNHGLQSIDNSTLPSLLGTIPEGCSSSIEELLVGPDRSPSRTDDAQKILAALNPSDQELVSAKKRNSILMVLARHTPELFDSAYFNERNTVDAYSVGRGRPKTSVDENLAWAASLGSASARDEAIRGVVHGLMDGGSHFSSMEISQIPQDSPIYRIAVSSMVEWLGENGCQQEADAWQSHLEQLK
ncbi:MAG: hypothetical protein WCK77_20960 [Verrucomicrobiota bacterium]